MDLFEIAPIFVILILIVTLGPLIALGIIWAYCCRQEQNEENQ